MWNATLNIGHIYAEELDVIKHPQVKQNHGKVIQSWTHIRYSVIVSSNMSFYVIFCNANLVFQHYLPINMHEFDFKTS